MSTRLGKVFKKLPLVIKERKMRWIKSSQMLPAEGVEVLIRNNEVVNIALYDKKRKLFIVRNGNVCDPSKEELLWAEILGPGFDVKK